MERNIQDYLKKRRPIFIVKVPDSEKRVIVYDPSKVPAEKKETVIVAPLNTDLSGWERLAKRC